MWIALITVVVLSILWILYVRRAALERDEEFAAAFRGLKSSFDDEAEALSGLDRSVAGWAATLKQAALTMEERNRGAGPSAAPENVASDSLQETSHGQIDESTPPGREIHDFGKERPQFIRLIRNWANFGQSGLKVRIFSAYLSNYQEQPFAFLYSSRALERSLGVWMSQSHFGVEGQGPSIESRIFAMEPKAAGLQVRSFTVAPRAGVSASEKDWVIALEENVIRMHRTFGTGKSYWLASSYLSGKELSPKAINSGAAEGLASLRSH